MFIMYMKLEFSTKLNTKLNIIREKRRFRAQRQTIEIETKENQLKSEENIPAKERSNKINTEDAKLLLQKMNFMNNQPSYQQNKQQVHITIPEINNRDDDINENNRENISIIVSETIPHAKNKFYE
jgi:hypothetical protein